MDLSKRNLSVWTKNEGWGYIVGSSGSANSVNGAEGSVVKSKTKKHWLLAEMPANEPLDYSCRRKSSSNDWRNVGISARGEQKEKNEDGVQHAHQFIIQQENRRVVSGTEGTEFSTTSLFVQTKLGDKSSTEYDEEGDSPFPSISKTDNKYCNMEGVDTQTARMLSNLPEEVNVTRIWRRVDPPPTYMWNTLAPSTLSQSNNKHDTGGENNQVYVGARSVRENKLHAAGLYHSKPGIIQACSDRRMHSSTNALLAPFPESANGRELGSVKTPDNPPLQQPIQPQVQLDSSTILMRVQQVLLRDNLVRPVFLPPQQDRESCTNKTQYRKCKVPRACQVCWKNFWTGQELATHIRFFHADVLAAFSTTNPQASCNPQASTSTIQKCIACSKSFACLEKLLDHERFHDGRFKCPQKNCVKGFNSLTDLKRHQSMQHRIHRCRHCERILASTESLRCHEATHPADGPFKCGVCDQEFLPLENLMHHMESHYPSSPPPSPPPQPQNM